MSDREVRAESKAGARTDPSPNDPGSVAHDRTIELEQSVRSWSRDRAFLPWRAVRPMNYALAAAALTVVDETTNLRTLSDMATELDYRGVERALPNTRLTAVDMCSGLGSIAAAASAIGADVTAVEKYLTPHLVSTLLNTYAADPILVRPSVDGWRGLRAEMQERAQRMIEVVIEAARAAGLPDRDSLWARVATCPACGTSVLMADHVRLTRDLGVAVALLPDSSIQLGPLSTDSRHWRSPRQMVCPGCGHVAPRRSFPYSDRAVKLLEVESGPRREAGAPSPTIHPSAGSLSEAIQLAPPLARNAADDAGPPLPWSWNRFYAVPKEGAFLPSITAIHDVVGRHIRKERNEILSDYAGSELAATAVATGLALAAASVVYPTSTVAEWSIHRATVTGPSRIEVAVTPVFAQPGVDTIKKLLDHHVTGMLDNLTRNDEVLRRPVRTRQASAEDCGLDDAFADLVVWDPPVYDNIDYAAYSRPLDLFVETALEGETRETGHDERRFADDEALVRQAAEIHRILRTDGRLGVYWAVRTDAELQRFVDMVANCGFDLRGVTLIEEARGRGIGERRKGLATTYHLTFIRTRPLGAAEGSGVDASAVLARAAEGKPALWGALAELLLRNWDEGYVEDMVPGTYKGSGEQRVVEWILDHADLAAPLVELGRRTLRVEADTLGIEVKGGTTTTELAELILSEFGFKSPKDPEFTIAASLDHAQEQIGSLALAADLASVKGAVAEIAAAVESVLRLTVTAWAAAAVGSDAALKLLGTTLSAGSVKPVFRADRMTMGDWHMLFVKLPGVLRDRNPQDRATVTIYTEVARKFKSSKISDKLQAFTRVRNKLAHDAPDLHQIDPHAFATDAVRHAEGVVQTLRELGRSRVLPRVLVPVQEVRDRRGRRILKLTGDFGPTEVFVDQEADLTRPVVYVPSGNNPRDASPRLLDAETVLDLARGKAS